MRFRLLVLLSMVLYGLACALPALGSSRPAQEVPEAPTMGWQCLVWGVAWFFMVTPLLFWVPNPWLWTLWVRALLGKPTGGAVLWGAVVYAAATVGLIALLYRMPPLVGAGLWVGAVAVGAEAARRTTEGKP